MAMQVLDAAPRSADAEAYCVHGKPPEHQQLKQGEAHKGVESQANQEHHNTWHAFD